MENIFWKSLFQVNLTILRTSILKNCFKPCFKIYRPVLNPREVTTTKSEKKYLEQDKTN
jgi:hypothetical protein